MQTISHNCCGIDVHKDTLVACIYKTSNHRSCSQVEEVEKQIREFKTFPEDLKKLRVWLESENCNLVAMESTGVYWMPVYEILEDSLNGDMEVLLVNARHMKNVPGKKTDIKDAEWIAQLLRSGLLKASFIPPKNIRELRQLTRYRKSIVQDITKQKNRIEKTLQMYGIKISSILTDPHGASSRKLLDAFIKKGSIKMSDVEMLSKQISDEKKAALKRVLSIKLDSHQRGMLEMQAEHLDSRKSHLAEVEKKIDKLSEPFNDDIERLDTIPGIAKNSAIAILAEISNNMLKFASVEQICSWAGLVPGNNESAGKKKSTRITHGNPYVKSLLVECALATIRMRNCYLANFYWKIKQKRGGKKAAIALARKILTIIYNLLKKKEEYNEEKFITLNQKQEESKIRRLKSEAQKLGFVLMPQIENVLNYDLVSC